MQAPNDSQPQQDRRHTHGLLSRQALQPLAVLCHKLFGKQLATSIDGHEWQAQTQPWLKGQNPPT